MSDPKEMSFLDHLEELRWHVIRGGIAIIITSIVAFFFMDVIFKYVVLGPARVDFITYRMLNKLVTFAGQPQLAIDKINFTLQSRTLSGQFTMHLTAAGVVQICS